MDKNSIFSLVEDILSKGILQKISKYSGIIADDIVGMASKESIEKLFDEAIKSSNEKEIPSRAEFIEVLKTEWDNIPERIRTKLLVLLYVQQKYMDNLLIDMILTKIYYDYKIA